MRSYFKYTNGEAFTLNGVDYSGFFNIGDDGNVYTGKTTTSTSELLTPKSSFISDFYLNKMEFDNQYNSIEDVFPAYANVLDILNKEEMDKIFSTINKNNLLVFKSLVINNPTIIDFDNNGCHYYGLSSTPIDMRADDVMIGKNVVSHIDPFEYSPEWEFLENIKHGCFLVKSDQTFKYLCTTGENLIILKGSFDDNTYIEYTIENLEMPKEVLQIHYDEYENKILIIINDEILIYDAINFIECDNLILIDSIKLESVTSEILTWGTKKEYSNLIGKWSRKFYNINPNLTEFMKFGNNYRTTLEGSLLYIWNKYSNDVISTINLEELGITDILDFQIRTIDDYIAILHENNGFNISFLDSLDVENTFKNYKIEEFDESENYRVVFSDFDSNVIFLNSKAQTQTRLISNPIYPVGQMREKTLKYPRGYKWGDTYQKFGNSVIKWNTNTLNSNFYTNYHFNSTTKSNINYILLHNSGRLYPLKQNISNVYQSAIDIATEKYFKGITCSDTSFGLFFNKNISSILKDILNLYTKSINSYIIEKNDVFLKKIEEITYETNNLYLNGNETINILSINRILNLINNLQKKLLANLIS